MSSPASVLILMTQFTTIMTQETALGTVTELLVSVAHNYVDPRGCVFTCPNGAKPRPNPAHEPTTNGCGAFGFQLDKNFPLKDLTKCCDQHDYCYDGCNNSKKHCDAKFKRCLQKICENLPNSIKKDFHRSCMSTADLVYSAAAALGCKPYKDAQKKACICSDRPRDKHTEL